MSETLINLIARCTDDPAERLLLALAIEQEIRESQQTETRSDSLTTYWRYPQTLGDA